VILIRELEPNEVLQNLKLQIDAFKPVFLAVEACQHKILEEKHYEEMRKIVRANLGDRTFIKDPKEINDLFKDFNVAYYNFEYFKEL
jgi:hypothetical protein